MTSFENKTNSVTQSSISPAIPNDQHKSYDVKTSCVINDTTSWDFYSLGCGLTRVIAEFPNEVLERSVKVSVWKNGVSEDLGLATQIEPRRWYIDTEFSNVSRSLRQQNADQFKSHEKRYIIMFFDSYCCYALNGYPRSFIWQIDCLWGW
ncbi:hypothetical protein BFJ70_g9712 [Fusarium oxysporum]|nr:hypothetical protein BFJ70_g9712 [Fusarium oxysporum]